MVRVHPQFIKDDKGEKSLVVITAKEFDAIMEELEELEDIRLYDEAVADDTGERMLLSDYLKLRKFRDAEIQGDADQSGTKAT